MALRQGRGTLAEQMASAPLTSAEELGRLGVPGMGGGAGGGAGFEEALTEEQLSMLHAGAHAAL